MSGTSAFGRAMQESSARARHFAIQDIGKSEQEASGEEKV
jgi:hypothetical protein